jgi:hypothetical protein
MKRSVFKRECCLAKIKPPTPNTDVGGLKSRISSDGLGVGLGFALTENAVAFLPLATFLENFDALETF